jgi:homoserine kinase
MKLNIKSVTVKVPGSTSNCGAGFDTLGLALKVYNTITLTLVDSLTISAQTAEDARGQAMVEKTAYAFFKTYSLAPVGFRYHISGEVPAARGLGSSVTVIAGIIAGLNQLTGAGTTRDQWVSLATMLEGHPDNASAGILGGFCVSRCDPKTNQYLDTIRFAVPQSVKFIVVSPSSELLTKESRGVLPDKLAYFDAVKSINSAAYVVAAFATGDYAKLHFASGDFMHEPYRLPKIVGAKEAINLGIAAGAFTGWLSGSGSSVLCVATKETATAVAEAMKKAFSDVGVSSESRELEADNHGLVIE